MKKSLILLFAAAAAFAVSCKQADPYEGRDAALLTFKFEAANNSAYLLEDVEGEIADSKIAVLVPAGTNIKGLKATFTTADAESVVTVNEAAQTSGETVNDFSTPVDYLVSLGPNKNAMFTVTVGFLPAARWSDPVVIDKAVGALAMDINPVSGQPVVAIVENAGSSRGPIQVYNGVPSTPVVASPADITCQYVALGVSEKGKMYIWSNDYQATSANRKGMVLTSADGAAWNRDDVVIDLCNAYGGFTVGTLGDEAFVLTSNNAAGAVAKRAINTTQFNGTSWSTGLTTFVSEAYANRYFPVMRRSGDALYAFITNVSHGFSIYKYSGKEWSEFITVDATSGDYAKYGYGINKSQDMAVAPNGDIYLAIGTSEPLSAVVLKIDATTKEISQVGSAFPLTNSISARYARVAVTPLGRPYIAFRDNSECVNVAALDEETMDWETPVQLTHVSSDDLLISFNAKGEGFVVCSVAASGDVPAHAEFFTLK